MANIPKGPGQAEVTGDLSDARSASTPGLYKDPESGAFNEVTQGAGADALVRMGWEYVGPVGSAQPKPAKAGTKAPVGNVAQVDDADAVEDQQDNAPGHKSETVDGPPGVPDGDPEKLAEN